MTHSGFATLPVVTTNHGPFGGELGDYYRAIAGRVPIVAISRHQASIAVRTPVAAVTTMASTWPASPRVTERAATPCSSGA